VIITCNKRYGLGCVEQSYVSLHTVQGMENVWFGLLLLWVKLILVQHSWT